MGSRQCTSIMLVSLMPIAITASSQLLATHDITGMIFLILAVFHQMFLQKATITWGVASQSLVEHWPVTRDQRNKLSEILTCFFPYTSIQTSFFSQILVLSVYTIISLTVWMMLCNTDMNSGSMMLVSGMLVTVSNMRSGVASLWSIFPINITFLCQIYLCDIIMEKNLVSGSLYCE